MCCSCEENEKAKLHCWQCNLRITKVMAVIKSWVVQKLKLKWYCSTTELGLQFLKRGSQKSTNRRQRFWSSCPQMKEYTCFTQNHKSDHKNPRLLNYRQQKVAFIFMTKGVIEDVSEACNALCSSSFYTIVESAHNYPFQSISFGKR